MGTLLTKANRKSNRKDFGFQSPRGYQAKSWVLSSRPRHIELMAILKSKPYQTQTKIHGQNCTIYKHQNESFKPFKCPCLGFNAANSRRQRLPYFRTMEEYSDEFKQISSKTSGENCHVSTSTKETTRTKKLYKEYINLITRQSLFKQKHEKQSKPERPLHWGLQ